MRKFYFVVDEYLHVRPPAGVGVWLAGAELGREPDLVDARVPHGEDAAVGVHGAAGRVDFAALEKLNKGCVNVFLCEIVLLHLIVMKLRQRVGFIRLNTST